MQYSWEKVEWIENIGAHFGYSLCKPVFQPKRIIECPGWRQSSGNGRMPQREPSQGSRPSLLCTLSMLSVLDLQASIFSLTYSFTPFFYLFIYIPFSIWRWLMVDVRILGWIDWVWTVNDGRLTNLPTYKNTAHAILTITRLEVWIDLIWTVNDGRIDFILFFFKFLHPL